LLAGSPSMAVMMSPSRKLALAAGRVRYDSLHYESFEIISFGF
jgi:hypothetical protein